MESSWSQGSVRVMILASFCGGVLFTMYYWKPQISLPRFDSATVGVTKSPGKSENVLVTWQYSLDMSSEEYLAKCSAPRNEIEILHPSGNISRHEQLQNPWRKIIIKVDSRAFDSEISSEPKNIQELPARECNYGYIVAKEDIFKGELGVPQLPNVQDVSGAVEQVEMCANNTGVAQYFSSSSNNTGISRTTAVFILTNWRSGSTFFGEVLSAHPAFFYYFEPMMYTVDQQYYLDASMVGSQRYNDSLGLISELFNCASTNDSLFTMELRKKWNTNDMNNKIRRQCIQLGLKCPDPEFLNKACQLFPIKLFKLTRLRGYTGEKLLELFPGSKLIYLLRDPRGIFASRHEMKWCQENTSCGNIEAMCCSLNLDLEPIWSVQQKYRSDVQVIKYEHLALNPVKTLENVFKNLQIPWHPNIDHYLRLHTGQENANSTMSTVRKSSNHINRWIGSLSLKMVDEIQRQCEPFMKAFDYHFLDVPQALMPQPQLSSALYSQKS